MKTGLVHLYCGDGKGKTTASVGLAVRAAGSGMRVVFVQFFKNGVSGEISVLRTLSCVDVLCEERYFGRVSNMTETEKKESSLAYTSLFRRAAELAQKADLLVLDEIVSACNHGIVNEDELVRFLDTRPAALEVVLTGRDPSREIVDRADYITEMCKRKHPFDEGIIARRGIEY